MDDLGVVCSRVHVFVCSNLNGKSVAVRIKNASNEKDQRPQVATAQAQEPHCAVLELQQGGARVPRLSLSSHQLWYTPISI